MINTKELDLEIFRRLERELQKEEPLSRVPELREIVERYLRRPAKLLRPRLLLETAATYEPADDRAPAEALYRLATATELLHVFALMHDDRIDLSGRPGVAPSDTKEREPLLVLAGDLLHTIAGEMVHETVRSFGLSPDIPGWIKTISVKTIAGQAMELSLFNNPDSLPDIYALYELYDLKTGYYTFVAPMVVGALAAGGGADLQTLHRIALLLGRAFQLQDDAKDISRLLGSGADGAPPWELGLLITYLSAVGRAEEARRITESKESRRALLREISEVPLKEWAAQAVGELRAEAETISRGLSISEERRKRLVERAVSIAELL
jgi:geranylgeranyl pyrophosphate synthase